MNKFTVLVCDKAYYEIEAENEEQAHEMAWEWFTERKPHIETIDKDEDCGFDIEESEEDDDD